MITSLAKKMTGYFALIFIGAVIMGIVPHTLLFLAGLVPLRMTAGGYHAKHHWVCIAIGCVTYAMTTFPLRYIPSGFVSLFILACCLFTAMTVWMLSPVEAAHKPLTAEKREKMRNISLSIRLNNTNKPTQNLFLFNKRVLFFSRAENPTTILLRKKKPCNAAHEVSVTLNLCA